MTYDGAWVVEITIICTKCKYEI